jgi:beta-glucosidase
LPLRKDVKAIAVVGPNANALPPLLGNYHGTPTRPATVLAGIRAAVGASTRVLHARGGSLVEGRLDPSAVEPIPSEHLRPAAGSSERGLRGEYFKGRDLAGTPVLTRIDPEVDFRWYRSSPTEDALLRGELAEEQALGNDGYSARWTGQLVPPVPGSYELAVAGDDGFRLYVDDGLVLEDWTDGRGTLVKTAAVDLEAGRPYDVRLEYYEAVRDAEVHLGWTLPGAKAPLAEALDAARAADVVVFVGGLSPEVEGEEMPTSYPGFRGGDRTDLGLPATQQKLLEALHATGKPVVVVLLSGSAVAASWAHENVPAILVGWYPGQQGGNAVADVLFGAVSPAGRLPVTFYRSVDQLPPFEDYDMANRTYRYFRGEPLYPFGHGLGYTRFRYSGLRLSRRVLGATDSLEVSLDVENVGGRDGDEVVQLYVRDVESRLPMPVKELRAFDRIHVARGRKQRVVFRLQPSVDFTHYDPAKKAYSVEPGEFEIQVGASSQDVRVTDRVRVE